MYRTPPRSPTLFTLQRVNFSIGETRRSHTPQGQKVQEYELLHAESGCQRPVRIASEPSRRLRASDVSPPVLVCILIPLRQLCCCAQYTCHIRSGWAASSDTLASRHGRETSKERMSRRGLKEEEQRHVAELEIGGPSHATSRPRNLYQSLSLSRLFLISIPSSRLFCPFFLVS